jgi:hypothetical protein
MLLTVIFRRIGILRYVMLLAVIFRRIGILHYGIPSEPITRMRDILSIAKK